MKFPRYKWVEGGGEGSLLEKCLANRGIVGEREVEEFLNPKLGKCVDPSLMRGMAEAAEIIRGFVERNEKIVIFADYDADGITGATIMRKTLEFVGGEVAVFLPDRAEEGYGFTEKACARCLGEHPAAKLLVTVDCGVSQGAAVSLAAGRGLKVIVTDHHERTGELPADASVVVLPYAEGNPESVRDLSGAGVAYKLAHMVLKKGGIKTTPPDTAGHPSKGGELLSVGAGHPSKGGELDKVGGFLRKVTREEALAFLHTLLPVVALGTVADVVPLRGENRILAAKGLEEFNRPCYGRNHGLEAIKEVAEFKGVARSEDFGFVFGPRINASGRIADPGASLKLLNAGSREEALPVARVLEENNAERRMLEKKALEEALEDKDARRENSVVYHGAEMKAGVAGLVASRLAEKWNVPAVACGGGRNGQNGFSVQSGHDRLESLSYDSGSGDPPHGTGHRACAPLLRGSARCPDIEGVHLTELLGECGGLLVNFGGHRAAAGLSLEEGKLGAFREAFEAACARVLAGKDRRPGLEIDAWVEAGEVTLELRNEMEKLQPFGEGNPQPLFAIAGAVLKGEPRKFGKTTVNWELSFEGAGCKAVLYRCEELGFGKGDVVDVVFALADTQFERLVMEIKDLRKG